MSELIARIRRPHTASRFHFARHLVEMLVSMWVGMMLGAFLLAAALGTSVGEARRDWLPQLEHAAPPVEARPADALAATRA